jgi:NAD+ synthase (glutamine-hydrolysing)
MYKNGFMKICLVSPRLAVGNPEYNVDAMLEALKGNTASIVAFPELGITAYTCGDLFFQKALFSDALKALQKLLDNNPYKGVVVCGIPLEIEEMVLNTAVVLQGKKILGVVPKFYLPNTKEFYDRRWFKSGFDVVKHVKKIELLGQKVAFGNLIFTADKVKFGIEICEDMWATITPGNFMSVNGANLIINISASNETLGKDIIRRSSVLEHSRKNCGLYAYVCAGLGESTSETVYGGHNIVASNGVLLAEQNKFSLETEMLCVDLDFDKIAYDRRSNASFRDSIYKYPQEYQLIKFNLPEASDYDFDQLTDPTPFVPKKDDIVAFEKIASIQEYALVKRLKHMEIHHVLIGISGGLDSSLALVIACRAFDRLGLDRKGIIAVTMPAMGTSSRTEKNALRLMKGLGVTAKQIDIKEHVGDHLALLGHDQTTEDITYENAQARSRTMILMNMANQYNGIVLGTGDLSEIALGWSTYNGDQMSMYNVNAGIPKTLVRFMIESYARHVFNEDVEQSLKDILATPISPELKKEQSTEAVIGKYEVNDFVLYRFLVCGDEPKRIVFLLSKTFQMSEAEATATTDHFFKRFFSQQFKRQASPDGPKVLDYGLSPRSDFRMPSDVKR